MTLRNDYLLLPKPDDWDGVSPWGAMAGLLRCSDESVDCIVTDPAYDSLEKWRAMGTTTRLKNSKSSSNPWFPVVPPGFFPDFFAQCYRVLTNKSHMYVMCDDEMSYILRPMMEQAGFHYRKKIIWRKVGKPKPIICPHCDGLAGHVRSLGAPGMGYPYRSTYEVILLVQKGAPRKPPENRSVRDFIDIEFEDLGKLMLEIVLDDIARGRLEVPDVPDVIEWERLKGKGIYPTQKPIPLLETLIGQSTHEGDLVLDPFAGSGATLTAASNLGRDFLGFDVVQQAKDWFTAVQAGEQPEWKSDDAPVEEEPMDILDLFGA